MKNRRNFVKIIAGFFITGILSFSGIRNFVLFNKRRSLKRIFDIEVNDNCTACGGCITVCHTLAIKNVFPELKIDKKLCTYCGYCEEVCPVEGIKVYVKKI